MEKYLDMERWPRRNSFQFFKTFEHPFFNVCVDVDVTSLRALAKKEHISLNTALLYLALRAANHEEPFRYRLRQEQVLVHDVIHGGSTVLYENETFGFWYFEYEPGFQSFIQNAVGSLADFKAAGPCLEPRDHQDNVLHFSVLPWIRFNSFAHARRHSQHDSVPKLVFGRLWQTEDRWSLPLSVEVHHALMDGLHVGRFLERFQLMLHECNSYWEHEKGTTLR